MVESKGESSISIFMCGDVMTGRGIDQILPHPVNPTIYEWFVTDARRYVDIAERVSGPIPRPVPFDYIWGEALHAFRELRPDVKLINLETSITTSESCWPGKGINYRMHPANIAALTAAGIDVCSLANNHVLDWGYEGLEETLRTLEQSNIKWVGAGRNGFQSAAPATVAVPGKGQVHVFSFGATSSGIPDEWAADNGPGINLLPDLTEAAAHGVAEKVRGVKREGDVAVASIHWGGNWGFGIPEEHVAFAHRLIDDAGIDIIHGHSSHHVLGMEVYREKLIIYGCGDFLTDYEGISGHNEYRGELGLMYFAYIDPADGRLQELRLIPTRVRKFQITRAKGEDLRWLKETLNREGRAFGTSVKEMEDHSFTLRYR